MPLKALLDAEPIVAPLLGDREWLELYFQRHRLALPCCPGVAVQMRGGAGTARIQHFSHAPLPTCQFRGETTAHLRAKVAIARGCAAAGWAAEIEHAAADWRADVLAERAGQRVALEVQWSRLTLGEINERQARYRAAGVRGCWFVRHPPQARTAAGTTPSVARQDLPLFLLVEGSEHTVASVQLGGAIYPLEEVVIALLSRRIAFRTHRTAVGEHALEMTFSDKRCPSCQSRVLLYAIAPSAERPLTSACGQRLLLWSDAIYHPGIARSARRASQAVSAEGGGMSAPLALMYPGSGFACPRCRQRLAPLLAGGPDLSAGRRTVAVSLTRPLCDPYPHWCYPTAGAFCLPMAGSL